jgi:hypothetical protein
LRHNWFSDWPEPLRQRLRPASSADLLDDRLGESVRLELEKIGFEMLVVALGEGARLLERLRERNG